MKDQFEEYGTKAAEKTPITEEGAPEGMSDSIHIPAGFLQGKMCKAGDKLVFTVVAADDEGVEVEMAEAAEEGANGPTADEEIDAMAADY